jgi:hypothetical protein
MLRKILLLIVFLVVIVIVLVATDVIDLQQRPDGTLAVETKDLDVGTTTTNVQVPVVKMENREVAVPSVGVQPDDPQTNGQ